MKGGLVKWNDHQMTHLTGSSQRISFQSIFKANISQTVETCIICTQSQLSGWLLESIKCVAQNQMSAPAFELQLLPLMNKYYHTFSPRLLSLQVNRIVQYFSLHFTCLPDCGHLLYGQLKTQFRDPWFTLIQLVLLFIACCCVTVSVVHPTVVVCLLASARLPPKPLHCHQEKIPGVRILRFSRCLFLETADL